MAAMMIISAGECGAIHRLSVCSPGFSGSSQPGALNQGILPVVHGDVDGDRFLGIQKRSATSAIPLSTSLDRRFFM
jgi:hypothetical protein